MIKINLIMVLVILVIFGLVILVNKVNGTQSSIQINAFPVLSGLTKLC